MRAIDFACRFLVNVGQVDLTLSEMKVLLSLASGMSESVAIAEMLDVRPCACTLCLRNLSKRALVQRDEGNSYGLTAHGKIKVEQLLSVNKES